MKPFFVLLTMAMVVVSLGWATGRELCASSPQLNQIMPRGVQRGGEHTLTFSGARLTDAEEVFLYDAGIEVVKLEPVDASNVKVTIRVHSDCRLGEHVAQLRCQHGISEYRTFFVGNLSEVAEVEPNNDFETPQPIELNSTVVGVCTSEDVDYYVLELEAGQRLSVEIEGMRLGTQFFDPYLAIVNNDRFDVATCDDMPSAGQDGYLSLQVPETGTYRVLVRDAAYAGNGNCHYRLHVGTFPRPSVIYPAGGKKGETETVQFLGDPLGPIDAQLDVGVDRAFRTGQFCVTEQGVSPSPLAFRQFDHGNAMEMEPNQNFEQATRVALPQAINGIIEQDGDRDYFKFTAKKGQVFDIECFAQRIHSPLDAAMTIYGPDKKRLAGNDDARGIDPRLRWTAPTDGEFYLRVRDHLERGSPVAVYRVEFHVPKAMVYLSIPQVARYSQYRQSIFVPRGNRFATLISATKLNYGGSVVLDDSELPAGMRMVSRPMAANLNLMPVVFEADDDAALSGKLVDLKAWAAAPNKENPQVMDKNPAVEGKYYNIGEMVLGPPNNARYVGCTVDRLPVAVVDRLPFKIDIVQPNVPIVQQGTINIKVVITRDEGFDAPVQLQFPFRPPGIGTRGSVNVPKGATEAYYPLNANANAQIGKWPVYVIASANVNGAAWVSSQLAELEIASPFVKFGIKRASCEIGQSTEVLCDLEQLAAFPGMARAELLGLPPHATAQPVEFDKDSKQVVFQVATTDKTPPGDHKSLFCRVTITRDGEGDPVGCWA